MLRESGGGERYPMPMPIKLRSFKRSSRRYDLASKKRRGKNPTQPRVQPATLSFQSGAPSIHCWLVDVPIDPATQTFSLKVLSGFVSFLSWGANEPASLFYWPERWRVGERLHTLVQGSRKSGVQQLSQLSLDTVDRDEIQVIHDFFRGLFRAFCGFPWHSSRGHKPSRPLEKSVKTTKRFTSTLNPRVLVFREKDGASLPQRMRVLPGSCRGLSLSSRLPA